MTESFLPRPGLLVSVRSAEEAEAALRGGADIIDVKEPDRGSLGRADDETIADVVQVVAGRVPVSAAMGELTDKPAECGVPGLSFAKWGLAGWANRQRKLLPLLESLLSPENNRCRNVIVAYADWKQANSPSPENLMILAEQSRPAAFVIDTFIKDGSKLLDWMSATELDALTNWGRAKGIRIALAGSLGAAEITVIRRLRPSWLAVRGAACSGGRNGTVDEKRVRNLKERISSFAYVT